ncbi:MAG: hypothetical protein M0Z47_10930 [Actinomycetota bacterium]|nr:hypothetical protein [Actinomycetota bacterium]
MVTVGSKRTRGPTYARIERQVRELGDLVRELGGPYAAPEELTERYLTAGRALWAARGRRRKEH